jgi:hypothetical protein
VGSFGEMEGKEVKDGGADLMICIWLKKLQFLAAKIPNQTLDYIRIQRTLQTTKSLHYCIHETSNRLKVGLRKWLVCWMIMSQPIGINYYKLEIRGI